MTKAMLSCIIAVICAGRMFAGGGNEAGLFISPSAAELPGLIKIIPVKENWQPIALPAFQPAICKINVSRNPYPAIDNPVATLDAGDVLFLNQHMAFRVNTETKTIEFIPPVYSLNPLCQQALNIAPAWLRTDLKIKFRELAAKGFDDDYAQLILDAAVISIKIVDETAFQVAYTSVAALTDTRFDKKDLLIRNAQFIYTTADSLKYVRLKEYGDYQSGNYYTTTEYRLKDGANGEIKWAEIPKEYYYWYIVHPKIYQEGVYEKDNASSSQQRTYGAFWRDYLWLNNVPGYDYTKVNITTSKGSVSTIPRFGEIIQKPELLWDREQKYYNFNRPFNDGDDALNFIGNWASRGLPVDARDNRPIQPNQALYEHNGNCGEDAYLVAAACRTALIPIVHLNTSCEDHALGAIWDTDWQHFEFFRGGLAESGNEFYGITNLLWGGSYGWKTSMVEGTRPDGYILNHTKYYAKELATIELTILDQWGAPVDGANVIMYAAPYAYGTGPVICGNAWTDSEGKVKLAVGAGKTYYFKFSHPVMGTLPQSDQIYVIMQAPAAKGQVYNGVSYYQVTTMPKINSDKVITPDTSEYGIHLNIINREIITSNNNDDSQDGKFYYRSDSGKASIGFFICDKDNYDKYLKGGKFESFGRIDRFFGDELRLGLPNSSGEWYIVLTNVTAVTNYKDISATCVLFTDFKDTPHLNIPWLESPVNTEFNLDKSLKLAWKKVEGAESYNIEVSADKVFGQLTAQSKDINTQYYDLSGLKDETTYYWRVKAVNKYTESDWSETWSFKTKPPKVLNAPALSEPPDAALNVSPNIILKWTQVNEAQTYNIQLSDKIFFNTKITDDTVTVNEYPLSGLEAGKKYYWRVRINDGTDDGPWAKAYSFTVGTGNSAGDDYLNNKGLNLLSVSPNPVTDNRLSLVIESAVENRGAMSLVNSLGQLVFVYDMPVAAGKNEYIFALPPELPAGFYSVVIESGSGKVTGKMVKM